jgi:uncharacterized protein (TIGR03083 family)
MPTLVDRDQIVHLLTEEFEAVAALCDGFDQRQWAMVTDLPGWSVQDVLAHLVGTESMLVGEPTPNVELTHLNHMANDIARANEAWVESMRPLAGAEVLDRFRSVTARRREALRAMTQGDFDQPSWTPAGRDETYGRFMRIRHYDCYLHEHDIRAAVGAADRDDPAHLGSALDETETALGYIVGRRAALPSGTSVAIRLEPPAERSWLVEVTDRARVVDRLEGEPMASISLPPMLFLRLTGGRVDPRPHIGADLRLGGDKELATQLATHLTFTI